MSTQQRDHYPWVTRIIQSMVAAGDLPNVVRLEIEPEFGYICRLTYSDGGVRITRGSDVGLNTSSAVSLANDKVFTRYFIEEAGFSVPKGGAFITDWWAERISPSLSARGAPPLRRIDRCLQFIDEQLGWPAYVKSVDGSQGNNVFCCRNENDLVVALNSFESHRTKVALAEEAVPYPDYRLVVLDGEIISCYRRDPLSVVGDGASSIAELAAALQASFVESGRDTILKLDDPRIVTALTANGLVWSDIPSKGDRVRLHDISNLSAGGTATEIGTGLSTGWADLCVRIAAQLGLRFCGVDLACAEIGNSKAPYAILEVNAAPGLDNYSASGVTQQQRIRQMYEKILKASP